MSVSVFDELKGKAKEATGKATDDAFGSMLATAGLISIPLQPIGTQEVQALVILGFAIAFSKR